MARARSRAGSSCIDPTTMAERCGLQSITPSANVVYNEIWKPAALPTDSFSYSYQHLTTRHRRPTSAASRCGRRPAASPFTTPPSARARATSIRCGRCRVPRPASTRRRRRRSTYPADLHQLPQPRRRRRTAVQLPAASLELTDEVSDEDALQLRAYRHLLFARDELELVMGARAGAALRFPDPPGRQWQPDASIDAAAAGRRWPRAMRAARGSSTVMNNRDACRYALDR